jgi:hypothetical protein
MQNHRRKSKENALTKMEEQNKKTIKPYADDLCGMVIRDDANSGVFLMGTHEYKKTRFVLRSMIRVVAENEGVTHRQRGNVPS